MVVEPWPRAAPDRGAPERAAPERFWPPVRRPPEDASERPRTEFEVELLGEDMKYLYPCCACWARWHAALTAAALMVGRNADQPGRNRTGGQEGTFIGTYSNDPSAPVVRLDTISLAQPRLRVGIAH